MDTATEFKPQFDSIIETIKSLKTLITEKTSELNTKLSEYKTAIKGDLDTFVNVQKQDVNESKTLIDNVQKEENGTDSPSNIGVIIANTNEAIRKLEIMEWANKHKTEILRQIDEARSNPNYGTYNINFEIEGYNEPQIDAQIAKLNLEFVTDSVTNLETAQTYYEGFLQQHKENVDVVETYFTDFVTKLQDSTNIADQILEEAKKKKDGEEQKAELEKTLVDVNIILGKADNYISNNCAILEDAPQNLVKLDGIINALIEEMQKIEEYLKSKKDDPFTEKNTVIDEKMTKLKTKGEELTKSILKMKLAKMLFYVPGPNPNPEIKIQVLNRRIKGRDTTTNKCIKIDEAVKEQQQKYTLYLYKNMIKKLKELQKADATMSLSEIVYCSLPTGSSFEKSKRKMPYLILQEESAGYIRSWVKTHIDETFGSRKTGSNNCKVNTTSSTKTSSSFVLPKILDQERMNKRWERIMGNTIQ